MSPPTKDADSGFTFVELLVAVTIFSLIATGIYAALHAGIKLWRRGDVLTAENQAARTVFHFVSSDLRNAVNYFPEVPFEGGSSQLSFMALLSVSDAGAAVPFRLMRVVYRFDASGTLERGLLTEREGFLEKNAVSEEVGAKLEGFGLEYSGKPSAAGFTWRKEWKNESELPFAVKVKAGKHEKVVKIPNQSADPDED